MRGTRMRLPDLEGLQNFVAMGASELPPVFVGREKIIHDIELISSYCWQRFKRKESGPHKNTRVLYGAPGAGKSATIRHLEREWGKGRHVIRGLAGPGPLMLHLEAPDDFMDGPLFAERLGNLLGEGLGAKARSQASRGHDVQVGVGPIQYQHRRGVQRGPLSDPIAAVLAACSPENWKQPLVLAIDEFQTIGGDMHAPHAGVLRRLHERGYAAPITLVMAGLGDTVHRAGKLGLSRLLDPAVHSLGCFSAEESRELVSGWGETFGLPAGDWQKLVLDLAGSDNHWPVHVHNALASLAVEVVRAGGDVTSIDPVRIRKGADNLRRAYYRQRMSPEMRESKLLLGAVMQGLRTGMDAGETINLIARYSDHDNDDVRWRLPEGMTPREYYRHLVHRGALHERGDFSVTCPIPSFRDWIVGNASQASSG